MAEKKIKGNTYKVEPMLAMDALDLKIRLLQVIGAGIDRLPLILAGRGDDATAEMERESNANAVAAFSDIFVKGDRREMKSLIKDIVESATVLAPSKAYDKVDVDFFGSDSLSEMLEVAVFVLRETFGAFFSELLANGKVKKVVEASQSRSSKE